jgi:hypothetical protein
MKEIKNSIIIEIKPSSTKEAILFTYMEVESKTTKSYILEKKIVPKDIFKMDY